MEILANGNRRNPRNSEFIDNFETRICSKATFIDSVRMERLLSVLESHVKKVICSVGRQYIFYATAIKTLKRDFGNTVVVAHLKIKNDAKIVTRYHLRQLIKFSEC